MQLKQTMINNGVFEPQSQTNTHECNCDLVQYPAISPVHVTNETQHQKFSEKLIFV